ncbi:cytochrome c3 family protein [Pseudomonadota bacterium]
MKNKIIIAVVTINLAALVLLTIFVPNLMVSPGKPIDAHAELTTDCFACHTPFIGSRPAKCISCHKVAEIGLKTTKGVPIDKEKKNVAFHQKLIEEDCVSCHSDHKGVMAFRPISQFSHNLLDSAVIKQCSSCHSNPGDALHLKIKDNCAQCHTQTAWTPATFDHKKYFRFDRDHTTDCVTCHINNDYADFTCYGCHEHSRSKIRKEHREEGIYDYENCEKCHRSGDEDEAKRIWRSKNKNKKRRKRDDDD